MKIFSRFINAWAFYLSTVFFFTAALLRTLLIYKDPAPTARGVGLLLAWLVLFASVDWITRRWPRYFLIYVAMQTALTALLLATMPIYPDYFAVLFAVVSMQIMQRYNPRAGGLLIAVFTPITFVLIIPSVGLAQAAALGLVYTGANALLAAYTWNTRLASESQQTNLELMQRLQETNRQLQAYSTQSEELTVARERSNLARELHDSVTQTNPR
jgi:signal transduction histidine kinase